MDTFSEFKEFISKQEWTFSKTYAKTAPHEYIIRGKIDGTDQDFNNAILFTRKKGFPMRFYKKTYTYLFFEGMFYWTDSRDVNTENVLNRCYMDDVDISVRPVIGGHNDIL